MKTIIAIIALVAVAGCSELPAERTSNSGVKQIVSKVETGSDGLTVEQRNVRDRLAMDNKPGSIKHLYVVSAYSGQVLFYSTVKGKVTSSGKRLSPHYQAVDGSGYTNVYYPELLEDDGTYGSSVEYLYWFDQRGVYHQHYVAGGQILHVSSEPIAVKSVVINLESK